MTVSVKILLAGAMCVSAYGARAQDKAVPFAELPEPAQEFIRTYYDPENVTHILADDDLLSSREYEVNLKDGIELEFDSKGNWTEVDANLQPVPGDIVPAAIQAYVSKSFPGNEIVQLSKSSRKYEIELTSGLDLEFDSKGQFTKIDD